MSAAQRWREQLLAWAIPDRIVDAVPDSPWQHPTEVFARRADSVIAQPTGASWEVAVEALRPSGTVLDVGAGAGAASLPLAPYTTALVAVDTSGAMLEALRVRAAALDLPTRLVAGRWPAVAGEVEPADVVLCYHVFYNVPDLAEFALALTAHARRRVVAELPPGHPMRALNPLWLRLHQLARPTGPTVADAVAVLAEVGIDARQRSSPRPARSPYPSMNDLVASTRRRLCLPPDRDEELTQALLDLGVDPAHPQDLAAPDDEVVTLWWDLR
jgi:SAM-dependent methyltransferase